jgi:transposase-like protein
VATGRPTKLTPELQVALCDLIRDGNYYEAACARVGIERTTFFKWMQRGRKAKSGPLFDFFNAVQSARAESEARVVKDWVAQIPENWQAARDFLARRFPARWGPKDSHEVVGKGGGPVQLQLVVEIVDGGTEGDASDGNHRPPDTHAPGAGGVPPEPGPVPWPGGGDR